MLLAFATGVPGASAAPEGSASGLGPAAPTRPAAAAPSSAMSSAASSAAPDQAHSAKLKLDKAGATAPDAVASWRVDAATGKVVVQTTDKAAAATFLAASGVSAGQAQVEQVTERPRLMFDLVGGDPIYTGGSRCSIGFSARQGANAYVITAGHCTRLQGNWSGYNGVLIGPWAAYYFPENDFGLIYVNDQATWTPTSRINGTASVLGSAEAPVGAQVCRSGSTTGYRCGVLQAKNVTVNYGGGQLVYGLTQTSACAEPGDSGGPYVTPADRQAQGVLSGGSGNCSSGGTTFYQPVNEILGYYGLTLVTG